MEDCPTKRSLNVDLDVHPAPDGFWSLYVHVRRMFQLSHGTYESLSLLSLGSLVICGVGGTALGLGIVKVGHTTSLSLSVV